MNVENIVKKRDGFLRIVKPVCGLSSSLRWSSIEFYQFYQFFYYCNYWYYFQFGLTHQSYYQNGCLVPRLLLYLIHTLIPPVVCENYDTQFIGLSICTQCMGSPLSQMNCLRYCHISCIHKNPIQLSDPRESSFFPIF